MANRRASPEAIAKRRAGRAFNDLFSERGPRALDGRTEKRRQRLIEELQAGKRRTSGAALKPLDMLSHLNELLELGETPARLKKLISSPRPLAARDELVDVLRRLQGAYDFRPEAYTCLGIDGEVLEQAGIEDDAED